MTACLPIIIDCDMSCFKLRSHRLGIIKGTPAGHDGRVAAVLVAVEVCQINWQTNGSDGGREVDGDHLDQCDVVIGFEVVILAVYNYILDVTFGDVNIIRLVGQVEVAESQTPADMKNRTMFSRFQQMEVLVCGKKYYAPEYA